MSKTLVEALERMFPLIEYETSYDNSPRLIAEKAATLLPLLVAHATEAERAALLRTLLGERFAQMTPTEIGELSDALAGLDYAVREEGRRVTSNPRGCAEDAIAILSALLAPEAR